jgi:hypothetical protein
MQMKTLVVAMTMIGAATLPAAAMELHASQRPLAQYLSAANNPYPGDSVADSREISRGRAFDRHGGNLFSVRCVGTYIGGWTEGYPGSENACWNGSVRKMSTALRQNQLYTRLDAVQLNRVSLWLETMIVAAGIALNRPSLRSYAHLATELSRGTVLLGHLSRHGLVTALALMLFATALATMYRAAA